jgi:hypothetical protein
MPLCLFSGPHGEMVRNYGTSPPAARGITHPRECIENSSGVHVASGRAPM